MKRTLLCAALLAILCAAVPLLCLLPVFPSPSGSSGPATKAASSTAPASTPSAAPAILQDPVLLWDKASDSLLTVSVSDYLIGAAACEMPASWPEEAIKAQMVACHSWALYRRDHPEDAQNGAWFSVDSAQCQGYATKAVLASRWGDDYGTDYALFERLAQEVQYDVVMYDNAPAAAAYHAISCGHTESSQNVWNESLPYLQGVVSSWDRYATDYDVTIEYSQQQFYDALTMNLGLTPGDDPADWVGDASWDDAGYVSTLTLCGQPVEGTQVRTALSLRSACFSIAYSDGIFTITTKGYGHGVGMSQSGACAMAKGGTTWRKILAYYFPGTTFGQA
jgi:stage II sporulation protein D